MNELITAIITAVLTYVITYLVTSMSIYNDCDNLGKFRAVNVVYLCQREDVQE